MRPLEHADGTEPPKLVDDDTSSEEDSDGDIPEDEAAQAEPQKAAEASQETLPSKLQQIQTKAAGERREGDGIQKEKAEAKEGEIATKVAETSKLTSTHCDAEGGCMERKINCICNEQSKLATSWGVQLWELVMVLMTACCSWSFCGWTNHGNSEPDSQSEEEESSEEESSDSEGEKADLQQKARLKRKRAGKLKSERRHSKGQARKQIWERDRSIDAAMEEEQSNYQTNRELTAPVYRPCVRKWCGGRAGQGRLSRWVGGCRRRTMRQQRVRGVDGRQQGYTVSALILLSCLTHTGNSGWESAVAMIALTAVSISAAVTLAAKACRSWGVPNAWLEQWALPREALEKIVPSATAAWISTALVAPTDGDAGELTAGIGQVVLCTVGALLVSSLMEKGWLKSRRK